MATAEALDTVIWFMMGNKPIVDHKSTKYSLRELGEAAVTMIKWGMDRLVISDGHCRAFTRPGREPVYV